MNKILLLALFVFVCFKLSGQGCCSGGSGSPIAGGASQGVLQDRQMEISGNYQHIETYRFFSGDKDTAALFDSFKSNYLYLKVAYGITKDLTMSVESGYFINKTQIGLQKIDTIKSGGIGDLILFPRYDIFNRTTETRRTEITFGLGFKIPLGKYDDSTVVYTAPITHKQTFTTSPPSVQSTTGSHDFIFYGFVFRGYPLKNFRIFANALYIRKGYNPLGEKFGDYASIGLYAGTTLFKKLGLTLQVKGEWVDKMKAVPKLDLLAYYNVDVNLTGSKKIFIVPQISFTQQNITVFALTEIPVYQYVNHAQVGSQFQGTVGVSYRFYTAKSKIKKTAGEDVYQCEMKCSGGESDKPGKCKVCGMDLIKQ